MNLRAVAIAAALSLAFASAATRANAACTGDGDCTAPPLSKCDTSEPTGACVECLVDTDCRTGLLCERSRFRASFGKCVQCIESNRDACTQNDRGTACLSSGSCGCLSDDDCGADGSLRVCGAGACVVGCRGDSPRGCPTGQSCTARGASIGSCVQDPTPPPQRADAGLPNPTPPVGPGGNCSIAGSLVYETDERFAFVLALTLAAAVALRRKKIDRARLAFACALLFSVAGCSRTPTPLRPGYEGSVGLPHRGVLVGGERVGETNDLKFLRDNERRWALPRFGKALTRAATRVGEIKPGSVLVVGDLSAKGGGVLLPHLSHRSGRDADLLLYLTTLEGAPVVSPGFVHVREDGLAWDERGKRFLRFDVERQWLLLKGLLEDEDARVQFVFASRTIRALIAEWAVARGESMELVYRALTVMVQPNPGGEHDDHFHVRTACTDEDVALGCEPSGPERPWLVRLAPAEEDGTELARALFEPIESPQIGAATAVRGAR